MAECDPKGPKAILLNYSRRWKVCFRNKKSTTQNGILGGSELTRSKGAKITHFHKYKYIEVRLNVA